MAKFSSCEIRDIPDDPEEVIPTLMMWANQFGLKGLRIDNVETKGNCVRLILDDEQSEG